MSSKMSFRVREIATETWTQIIEYLPYHTQVSLLHVSRRFHDIALGLVFASVKIYLVAGNNFIETFVSYPFFFDDMDRMAETLMRHSWEILTHISENRAFASLIRTLSIVAYADSSSVFERLSLEKALVTMTGLKEFYWFGNKPELPYDVINSLPSQLRTIHIQSTPSGPTARFPAMHIQDLQLETLFHIPPRMHSQEPDISFWLDLMVIPSNTIATLKALWTPDLRRLSLLSQYVREMSMLEFASLTELDLCATGGTSESEVVGLDLVFHHTPKLQSVSLRGYLSTTIFPLLPKDPTILPELHSFRLSFESWADLDINEAHIHIFVRFLETRTALRRLSLRLGNANWELLSLLLPTLRSFSALEVLGLHAGAVPMSSEGFESLASIITPRMTAIQLIIPWNQLDTDNVDANSLAPLLQRLQDLPQLRFIHLYSIGRILPINQEDLANDLAHLETIGFDRCLWDVSNGSLIKWKPWSVQYAAESDFHSSDDAWLFSHI